MRALLACLLAATAFAATASAQSSATTFRLPDGSAACTYRAGVVACRSVAVPQAIVLGAKGSARVRSVGVEWTPATPVLGRWRAGGIGCHLSRRTIVCANGTTTIFVDAARIAAVV